MLMPLPSLENRPQVRVFQRLIEHQRPCVFKTSKEPMTNGINGPSIFQHGRQPNGQRRNVSEQRQRSNQGKHKGPNFLDDRA